VAERARHGGDDGTTGTLGDLRLPKYDLRIETLGAIDEVSSAFGLARAMAGQPETKAILAQLQRDLYLAMSEVSATGKSAARFTGIDEMQVEQLEQLAERLGQNVQMPDEFILPGDTLAGAAMDLARTAVRKAERRLTELVHRGDVQSPEILRYFNRLSTVCYLLELFEIEKGDHPNPTLARQD
jgi:cob(I)alamin adenosyltransferase